MRTAANNVILAKQLKTKKFLQKKKRNSGRNNRGKITVYHKGGGNKKKYRIIDLNKFIWNIKGVIKRIEYDPNRTSLITLISYSNGIICYALNINSTHIGDIIHNKDEKTNLKGCGSYLKNFKLGDKISQLEYYYTTKAQYSRTSGSYSILLKNNKNRCLIKLSSLKYKIFKDLNTAVFGEIFNYNKSKKKYKKAGYNRAKGRRPSVRGVSMNPIDHPHGGGEGKGTPGRPSVTPWGIPTKGSKTKKKWKKYAYDKFIKKI